MISRRRLFALVALPGVAWIVDHVVSRRSVASRLAELIERRRETRALGMAYLELFPEEAAPETLVASLLPEAAKRLGGLQRLTKRQLHDAVRRQRQLDFAGGNTVMIDGWILARTEARLCALTIFA